MITTTTTHLDNSPALEPEGGSNRCYGNDSSNEAQARVPHSHHEGLPVDCASNGDTQSRPSPARAVKGSASGTAPQPVSSALPAKPVRGEDWRISEANRRLAVLQMWQTLIEDGMHPHRAARQVGQGHSTLFKWRARYNQVGFEGLIPRTARCGRKSMRVKLAVPAEVIHAVRGIALDTESVTAAWRIYAQSDACPAELAQVILDPNRCSKHAIPPSLRSAAKIDENLQNAHRGPRRLSLKGMWTPRRVDILPGDIFTSDDTTPIWAWWVPWVKCADYPFGVKVLQGQFLPVMDVASQAVVAFVLIAREKASYRAADIWSLFGHTFDTVGLPRLGWQLERGSWEANLIRGESVEYEDGEPTQSRRVGGLRMLPSNVTDWHRAQHPDREFSPNLQTWTSYLPKSKSIEAWFNRSQTLEGTLWGALGRDQQRRPIEKTKKIYEACKRGAADPREYFLSQTQMVSKVRALIDYLNHEPMEGEVFRGIPIQLFEAARKERPLLTLPDDQRYLYARDRKLLTITQGWARVRLTDGSTGSRYSLFYSNPEVFASLEGQQVVVYYDAENFDAPAQVHLAKTGQWLCAAEYFERRGSFLDGDKSGHDLRKAWRSAVMSAYGTVASYAPSRQRPEEIKNPGARRAETATEPTETRKSTPMPAPAPRRDSMMELLH